MRPAAGRRAASAAPSGGRGSTRPSSCAAEEEGDAAGCLEVKLEIMTVCVVIIGICSLK